jgi:hypothetical protein
MSKGMLSRQYLSVHEVRNILAPALSQEAGMSSRRGIRLQRSLDEDKVLARI